MPANFIADGPADAGFKTEGPNINDGVNVRGTTCGVYAEGGKKLAQTFTPGHGKPVGGTGVYATGDRYGVYGISGNIKRATNDDDDQAPDFLAMGAEPIAVVGVNGPSSNGASPAIVGANAILNTDLRFTNPPNKIKDNSTAVDDLTRTASGVVGISKIGIGIVGCSLSRNSNKARNTKADVARTINEISNAGVTGISVQGPGVHGVSRLDRGGVFESRTEAQINLKPILASTLPQKLPPDGKTGDFLVIGNNPGTPDEFTELWFCDKGKTPARGAHWSRVQFDQFFQT